MKLKGINYFSLLLGLVFFFSCSDEDLLQKKNDGKEGTPTAVNFSIKNTDAEYITTKADANAWQGIRDLYILTFNAQGECDGGGYFIADDEGVLPALSVRTYTGDHTVYAYANVQGTHLMDIKGTLDKIINGKENVSQLSGLTSRLKEQKLDVVSNIVQMTGFCAENEQAAKDGKIKTVNITDTSSSFTIYLQRVISVITFKINPSNGITFVPASYRVGNIPEVTTLNVNGGNFPTEVFDSNLLQNFVNDNSKYSFQFTMLENGNNTPQGVISNAKDREARENSNAPLSETNSFTKAPLYSTYVVLSGHYEGPGKNGQGNVDADVTYYIHLGNTSGGQWSEFKTVRNKNYTYNVNIKGVNDIYTEVEMNDPNDRIDGTIVTGGQTKIVDCHYEAVVIKLSADTRYKFVYDGDKPWIKLYYNGKNANAVDYTSTNPTSGSPSFADEGLITTAEALNDKLKEVGGDVYFTCFVEENYGNDSDWRSYANKPNRQFKILPESTGETTNGSMIIDGEGIIISQRSIQTFYNLKNVAGNGTAYGVEWVNESGKMAYKSSSPGKHDSKNGYENMVAELGNADWNTVYTVNQAYIACMQRNRDENRDGKIDGDEIKWYLPSLDQLTGLWVGAPILGDARLYTGAAGSVTGQMDDYHYWSSTSSNSSNDKYYLWAEEGSSFGTFSYTGEMNIRCVRTLGNTSDFNNYYNYDKSNRIFTLRALEDDAVRANVHGELKEHTELDAGNNLPRSFEVAKQNTTETPSLGDNFRTYPFYKWIVENTNITSVKKSACDGYQQDGDGDGWRLPNQRELSLMNREKLLEDSGEFAYRYQYYGPLGVKFWSLYKNYNINYLCRTKFSGSHRHGYGQGTERDSKSTYMRLYTERILNQSDSDYKSVYASFKIRCVRDK